MSRDERRAIERELGDGVRRVALHKQTPEQ